MVSARPLTEARGFFDFDYYFLYFLFTPKESPQISLYVLSLLAFCFYSKIEAFVFLQN